MEKQEKLADREIRYLQAARWAKKVLARKAKKRKRKVAGG